MRNTILLLIFLSLTACASTYEQNHIVESTQGLNAAEMVLIATPKNGFYANTEYPSSGRMTADAVRNAFASQSNNVAVSAECNDLQCLKASQLAPAGYYVVPEILHWEDRATEWSGKKDQIKIKLVIYSGATGDEVSATVITGKSKWATLGGDHPQDLLPEPLGEYINSLY